MKQDWEQLSDITKAQFQVEQARLSELVAKENGLRDRLEQLRQTRMQSMDHGAMDSAQYAIGGDILWQAWLSKKKAMLDAELAQVLAQKSYLLDSVRLAFAKDASVQELLAETKIEARHNRARHGYDVLNQLSVFSQETKAD